MKTKIYYSQVLEGTWPARKATQRGHRCREQTWALPFLGSEGWGFWASWAHTLLANLKRKSGNQGTGDWRQGHLSDGHFLGGPGFSERGSSQVWEGLIPHLVVLLVAITQLAIHLFEMDVL